MKRRLVSLFGVLPFAFGLAFAGTLASAPAHAVGACGWYTENVNSARTGFISTYTGSTDYLVGVIVTYNDGCGHKQYESELYTQYHTPLTYTIMVRAWAGGPGGCSYKGEWGPIQGTVVWSAVESYSGFCGRSADNNNSYAYGTYDANGTTHVYVNQG